MIQALIKPVIQMVDLETIDVRVGTIESVAPIRLERENPREIEGRQALFVVNLPPRTIRDVVSEGMLFDIGYADGITPVLAVPEGPVPDSARAG